MSASEDYVGSIFALFQFIMSCLMLINGIIGLIVKFEFSSSIHWIYFLAITFILISICSSITLLEYCIRKWDEKYKTEKMHRCEKNLTVGLAGCVLCGYIIQAGFMFSEPGSILPWLIVLICQISAITFLVTFVSCRGTIDYKDHENLSLLIGSLKFILLFVSQIIYVNYQDYSGDNGTKKEIHDMFSFMWRLAFTILYLMATVDLCIVLNGGVRKHALKKKKKSTQVRQDPLFVTEAGQKLELQILAKEQCCSVEVQDKSFSRSKNFECQICLLEYSESRGLRILKECGHTVCQQCVENLLKQSDWIACPFCREVTVVDGPATKLPKNYTVLEMILERKIANIV